MEGGVIGSEFRFLKPWTSMANCYGYMEVAETLVYGGAKVSRGFAGKNKYLMIMMLFMSMHTMVGKDFEEGLFTLKSILKK
ncbi:MAG: hypothetical protein AAGA86_12155 [Bacteroidota bacterium]